MNQEPEPCSDSVSRCKDILETAYFLEDTGGAALFLFFSTCSSATNSSSGLPTTQTFNLLHLMWLKFSEGHFLPVCPATASAELNENMFSP